MCDERTKLACCQSIYSSTPQPEARGRMSLPAPGPARQRSQSVGCGLGRGGLCPATIQGPRIMGHIKGCASREHEFAVQPAHRLLQRALVDDVAPERLEVGHAALLGPAATRSIPPAAPPGRTSVAAPCTPAAASSCAAGLAQEALDAGGLAGAGRSVRGAAHQRGRPRGAAGPGAPALHAGPRHRHRHRHHLQPIVWCTT